MSGVWCALIPVPMPIPPLLSLSLSFCLSFSLNVIRKGGLSSTFGDKMTYFPNVTLVIGCGFLPCLLLSDDSVDEVIGGGGRTRSPRMQTLGERTHRPPSVMCWVPCSWARRETLLPVSVSTQVDCWVGAGGLEGGILGAGRGCFGGGRGDYLRVAFCWLLFWSSSKGMYSINDAEV